MKKKYKLVGLGGTFDLFHKGHASFLHFGLHQSEKLLIGISSDQYASMRKGHITQPYEKRKQGVEQFLKLQNALGRVSILPLDSVYIPKEWDNEPIGAILVTPDSLPGALEINRRRKEEKKSVFAVMSSPLCIAEDRLPLSSSRIWEGMIDREGKTWAMNAWYTKTLVLPASLREVLRSPFGEIMDAKTYDFSKEERDCLIAVGDVTTKLLHDRNIIPKLSVIDLLVERKRRFQNVSEIGLKNVSLTYTVQNTPGQISPLVFQRVRDAFLRIKQGKTVLLHIIGEEDLTVLPILLQAPLGWVLCYGQPKIGTVKVIVDEEIKKLCKEILQKFTIR